MLVIRLARGGRTKYPTYRIVAAESARAATGKFIEVLGHYNPHTKELVIKKEETERRLNNGAQPSNTVVKLLQKEQIELPKWVKLKTKTPKKDETSETEAPVEAATKATEAATVAEAAPADEERVAEAATENAADVQDEAVSQETTETTEMTEEAAEKADEGSDAAAEAAENAAEEAKS